MGVYLERFLLYTFLISAFFLGGFVVIGPFSPKIYSAVLLLVVLIVRAHKFPFFKEVKIYIVFILLYIFALYAIGELSAAAFLNYFLSRYFMCFLAFYAVYSVVNTKKQLNNMLKFICILGVINAIISIMQFMGNFNAIQITYLLNPIKATEGVFDQALAFTEGDAYGIGAYGLFQSSVMNGYFSVIAPIIILYFQKSTKNRLMKIFLIISLIILLAGLYTTQQRLVAILVVLFYLIYLYLNTKILLPIVGILLVAILYIVVEWLDIGKGDLGRLKDLKDEHRVKIYTLSIEYILDNLWFGGQLKFGNYLNNNGIVVNSSHNIVFNAFIYSGFFGGIVVVYLYLKLLLKSLIYTFKQNKPQMFIAGALMIYLLNSLTHNASLVTGDETIWILLALLFVSNKFKISNENSLHYR